MIILNADDWGRSRNETDTALICYKNGRITSGSAMVFMEDSFRAADIAKDTELDLGLHLNFDQRFTGKSKFRLLGRYQNSILHYIRAKKYNYLIYNPNLKDQFRYVYQAQVDEFFRLYEKPPSHINGHHHLHLSTNVLLDKLIPQQSKVRRNFSFWPGEKNIFNRKYRSIIDLLLSKRYVVANYFFSLSQVMKNNKMGRVVDLSKTSIVELETHPNNPDEFMYLMSDSFNIVLSTIVKGTYSLL